MRRSVSYSYAMPTHGVTLVQQAGLPIACCARDGAWRTFGSISEFFEFPNALQIG